MVRKLIILLALIPMLFSGCNGDDLFGECNCNDEMNNCTANHGDPEEINKYDSGDYHSWTFWYWCQGFSMTFTWGTNVEGCCETSTYTFSPICG